MIRAAWIVIALGVVLRVVSAVAYDAPRGDVVLDVGVARSVADGQGYRSGFERGVVRVSGEGPLPPQGHADQHPPLWPTLGALLTPVTGSPFVALRVLSLLSGLGLILLVMRQADRITESVTTVPDGMGPLAGALTAATFVAVDGAANGSLYALQALLVLATIERLARPRPGVVAPGVLLGLLCLLNHQALVLLPLPLVVRVGGACPGRRLRPLVAAAATVGVALLCQLPWWWRNLDLFGSPTFSVNGLYLRYWAGLVPRFGVEDGVPVVRLIGDLGPVALARAMLGFAPMNGLYLFGTGLLVWPGLLGVAVAAAPGLMLGAWRARDRRLLGLGFATAALLAVSVLWPATKLRYLVTLQPLVLLLGVAAMVRPWQRGERALSLLVALGWAALLALTWDDFAGDGADARPGRFAWLAGGGLGLLVLPLLLRRARGPLAGAPLAVVSGLPVALALSLAVAAGPSLGVGTGTAYHGSWFWPDVFGRDAEAEAASRADLAARAAAGARAAGLATVAGPIELLAHEAPALVELPSLGPDQLVPALQALLDQGRMDGVVLTAEPGETPATPFPFRLVPVEEFTAADGRRAVLSRVRGL